MCLRALLLPTSSTPAYPGCRWTLTRWPRSTMPSLTVECHSPGRYTKDSNGQITAGVERCCACYHRHSKFDRGLGQILHDQLHWLDVPDRVLFKLAVTVHQCLNGRALPCLSEHCIPVSSADTRRHLRSANSHLLAVPRFRLNTYGRRAFSVADPIAWNSLPEFYPGSNEQHRLFSRLLKTYLFARY